MTIKVAGVWPVNSLGEIVLQVGTGNQTVTGFLTQDQVPIDVSTNKVVVNLPDLNSLTLADLITGFVSGAGTVAATDTILEAFNKLDGNVALKANAASPVLTGITDTEARQLGVREVTAAGVITMNATDDIILVNKTVGAATGVTLTAGTEGRRIQIKDKKADANTNNITLTPNGAETIDGAATFVINVARQSATLVFKGTEWSVI